MMMMMMIVLNDDDRDVFEREEQEENSNMLRHLTYHILYLPNPPLSQVRPRGVIPIRVMGALDTRPGGVMRAAAAEGRFGMTLEENQVQKFPLLAVSPPLLPSPPLHSTPLSSPLLPSSPFPSSPLLSSPPSFALSRANFLKVILLLMLPVRAGTCVKAGEAA
eukprot:748494-Hanusia_phi.AAC.1